MPESPSFKLMGGPLRSNWSPYLLTLAMDELFRNIQINIHGACCLVDESLDKHPCQINKLIIQIMLFLEIFR